MAGTEPAGAGQPGHGGQLRPVEPASGGALSVRGGVGGISFQLQELDAGAHGLEVLARDLAAVELGIYRVWEGLGNYQRDEPFSGAEALTAVWEGQRSVAAVREELEHLAGSVRGCQLEYSAAEGANVLVAQLGLNTPWLAGEWLADSAMSGDGRPNRASTEAMAGSSRLLGGAVLAALLGTPPGEVDAAARMALAPGGGTGVPVLLRMLLDRVRPDLRPRPVTAEPVTGTGKGAADTTVDTSPAGLLARAGAVDEAGPGQIEVIRTANGGRDAFIVIIPGTQPGNMGGPNPLDEVGIGESLGYGSEYTAAGIRSALRQAGAEAGDHVVAVGYSQGGIHAMNLGQDKAFLAEYDLKYVLTAGSPVGAITPAPGVSSLHLEHRQDWVPGSEGLPNPDTRDRVTVTLNGLVRTPSGEDSGLGPGHRLTNYEAGARAVSASADPSLAASTAVLAGVVGTGGAATVSRFQLVRAPRPPAPTAQPFLTPAWSGAGKAVLPGNVLPGHVLPGNVLPGNVLPGDLPPVGSGGGAVSGGLPLSGGGRPAAGLPPAK